MKPFIITKDMVDMGKRNILILAPLSVQRIECEDANNYGEYIINIYYASGGDPHWLVFYKRSAGWEEKKDEFLDRLTKWLEECSEFLRELSK